MGLFQSAPVIADGRTAPGRAVRLDRRGFNPRPSLLTGEPGAGGQLTVSGCCFNPRPSLLTGEPGSVDCKQRQGDVSIRARHC